jgi:HEAT repeat protein
LKAAIHEVTTTGSDTFFMSPSEQTAARDVLVPSETTVRGVVVPALLAALEKERANDIVTGCLIALARIGDARGENGASELEPTLAKFLADGNQEIAETAAVALGILAEDSSVALLGDLANDAPKGRARVGNKEVHYRTRAFATYGLGLIGARTASDRVRREIAQVLVDLLGKTRSSTRDLEVAALVALGLVRVDLATEDGSGTPRNPSESRQGEIRFVEQLFRDEAKDSIVRAHAPATLARLLPGAPAETKVEIAKLLLAPLAPHAKDRVEIQQACALALGQVGDADGEAIDIEIRETLARIASESRDAQSKGFAMIALGQIGGTPGRGDAEAGVRACRDALLAGLAQSKGNARPWAAIGLAVLERALGETDAGRALASPASKSALRTALQDAGSPSPMSAFAIACGIARDVEAKSILRDKLKTAPGDEVRGYVAVALGLVRAREAAPDIEALVLESKYKPALLRESAIGLGLLGDKNVVPELVKMLGEAHGFSAQAALASALGFIGDARSIQPLVEMLQRHDITDSARGFAAVALGIVADKEALPWNSKISTNVDYRASTVTLTGPDATGILDLL